MRGIGLLSLLVTLLIIGYLTLKSGVEEKANTGTVNALTQTRDDVAAGARQQAINSIRTLITPGETTAFTTADLVRGEPSFQALDPNATAPPNPQAVYVQVNGDTIVVCNLVSSGGADCTRNDGTESHGASAAAAVNGPFQTSSSAVSDSSSSGIVKGVQQQLQQNGQ